MSLEEARKPGREGHALARAAYNQGITEPGQTPTALLHAWSRGEPGALDALVPLVHDELRRLARTT